MLMYTNWGGGNLEAPLFTQKRLNSEVSSLSVQPVMVLGRTTVSLWQ